MKMRFTADWLRKRIETDPDLDCEAGLPDTAFWCACGEPISQDPETEKRERAAGMCLRCIGEAQRA